MLADADVVIRLVLAVVAGALIGLEREKTRHAAGLRTHMLVCIGATLVTLVSLQMFPNDPARVTAGIITGVGFLGAGMIFRDKNHVRGLTTAASIWAVAGVGLALGTGAYVIAAASMAAILLTLELDRIKRLVLKRR
ncbi:MgtC/SapB family protein [Candidatus Woesearchaeota archaeon]|nr:MgtC/SapB family protein [Candidatus Woesearchaeota archaeon]